MANTSSAKKAARKMLRRTEINKSRRSQLKAYVRKVEEALASGDKARRQGRAGRRRADSHAHRAEGRHPQDAASRKVSRLAARVRGAGLNAVRSLRRVEIGLLLHDCRKTSRAAQRARWPC